MESAIKDYRELFEGVATDVNPQNQIPFGAACIDPVDNTEYFDENTTITGQQKAISDKARTAGARNIIAPGPGRTSLGIPGNCRTAENVCSDCSSTQG